MFIYTEWLYTECSYALLSHISRRKIFENVQVFISKGCVCYIILGTL